LPADGRLGWWGQAAGAAAGGGRVQADDGVEVDGAPLLELGHLGVGDPHQLAQLEGLRLRAWAHMLGFGGHWSTKSRRYSTTMGALRRARVTFAKRRRARDGVPLDAFGRAENDQAVIVLATWTYVAAGYATEGERWLALSAAARAREQRRMAWEELRTTAA
jgi:hypothetical protein